MAFDLSTAKPVKFDMSTAAPPPQNAGPSQRVGRGGSLFNNREQRKEQLRQELTQNQSASDAAGRKLDMAESGVAGAKDLGKGLQAAGELGLTAASYVPAVPLAAVGSAAGLGGYRDLRNKMTYTPRGEGTREVMSGLGDALAPVADFVEPVTSRLGEAGSAVLDAGESIGIDREQGKDLGAALVDAVGLGLGGVRPRGAPAVAPGATLEGRGAAAAVGETLPQKPDLIGEFRAGGFSVPPSTAASNLERLDKGGVPGRISEAFAGGQEVRARSALQNQRKANEWTLRALPEYPKNTPLDKKALADYRVNQGRVYDEVREVIPRLSIDRQLYDDLDKLAQRWTNNPLLANDPAVREAARLRERVLAAAETSDGAIDINDILDAVRKFRESASLTGKTLDDPTKKGLSEAYREAADSLENAIERQAGQWGSPDLVQRLKTARTNIAKSYDIEDSLIGDNINVAQLVSKYENGAPLTGELEYLARMGQEFGPEMKRQAITRNPQGGLSAVFAPFVQAFQRAVRPGIARKILGEEFQTQHFGPVDDALLAQYLNQGPEFPWSVPKEAPPGPGARMGSGPPVPFSGSPEVPPQAALRPGLADEFVPEPAPGAQQFPPAAANVGDLEARPVPPITGDVPYTPEGPMLGDLGLDLAPPTRGDINYRPGDVPPEAALSGRRMIGESEPSPTPGSGAMGLEDELLPPLTDMELLDLELQAQNPPVPRPAARSQMTERPPSGDTPPPAADLGAELTLADDNAPVPQRLELDEGGPVGGGRKVKTTDTGLDLYEGPPDGGVRVGTKAVYPRNGDLVFVEGDPARAKRALIMRPQEDGSLRIASTEVDPASRGSGLGKDNLLQAIREGTERGARVDSDNAVSVDQMRVYESLTKAGRIEADQMPDWDSLIREATQSGQKSYKRPGDVPVVSGLRLSPKGPKG